MKNLNVRFLSTILLGLILTIFSGCVKPPNVPDLAQVQPNETAWLIPLDGSSQGGQVKFDSIEFLNAKKIAAKRISIPKTWRKTGYDWQWWAGEYIPTARLITVDRRLITTEWVDNTATENVDEGIPANTKDNIRLTLGVTLTVSISEEDASTYLYYHGQRPLTDVANQNIRSYITAELNKQVSGLSLDTFQTNQAAIYNELFADTAKAFKAKGVTIEYLGNAKGWHFANKEIQESINRTFVAQQDKKTAENEKNAQETRNLTLIMNADAQKQAAEKLFAAQNAASFQNDMKIKMLEAEAHFAMATNWDGKLPANILPANSSLLMNLGK